MRAWLSPYRRAGVWLQSLHFLLGLAVGVGLFTAAVTMLATGAGLAITVVGIPLLALTVWAGRGVAALEHARFAALLGEDIPLWPAVQWPSGWWPRLRRALTDGPGWRGLGYSMVVLPWSVLTFTVTVTLWSVALGLASAPLWAFFGDDPPPFHLGGQRFEFTGWWKVAGVAVATLLGWLLVAALPRLIGAMARLDARVARAQLSPDPTRQLQARVEELQERRDASVASAASELRRIERDLHDGAQQRLVSLAMNLGMAKERLGDQADDATKALVTQAHDEAKLAIAELRDLVRGIHPAVLTDRGLDAAVSALAARCPVPAQVDSNLGGARLPAACEGVAYFVVAEALTNVAKHSGATAVRVRLQRTGDVMTVEVVDDGVGGAVEAATGGLRGLGDRVRSVDGRLRVASPQGGPTAILAELPCGS